MPLFFSCADKNSNTVKRLFILQEIFLQVMYFLEGHLRPNSFFKDSNILKLCEKHAITKCLLM